MNKIHKLEKNILMLIREYKISKITLKQSEYELLIKLYKIPENQDEFKIEGTNILLLKDDKKPNFHRGG